MEAKLPGDLPRDIKLKNDVTSINLDNQSFEGRVVWQLIVQKSETFRIAKKANRQIDRDFDVAVFDSE